MNFEISCEIYVKLTNILTNRPIRLTNDIPDIEWANLQCIRLENKGGNQFAIASNRKIAGVYYLGKTAEKDGDVHITIDPILVEKAKNEIKFSSKLHIVSIPELNMCSIKTTFGYNYPGNGQVTKESRLADWRTWRPDRPVLSPSGAMTWQLADMISLCKSCPSGEIVFPEFIDANKPVILRDVNDPNWIGMFMSNCIDPDGRVYISNPATIPEWAK